MATLRPEVHRDGRKLIVSRGPDGRFAPGSTAPKGLELWSTKDGAKVRVTDRDWQGKFLPATNFSLSI